MWGQGSTGEFLGATADADFATSTCAHFETCTQTGFLTLHNKKIENIRGYNLYIRYKEVQCNII